MCHSSEVEPASGVSTPTFFFLLCTVFASSYSPFLSFTLMDYWSGPLGELSKYVCVAKTEHRRFSPPLLSFRFVCLSERLRRSHGEVTRGPAGQLVLIASGGLFFFFWGPPSQPGCSDVRRAGHQPSGNVQAATHRGNRRTAQTHTVPSLSLFTHMQVQIHTCSSCKLATEAVSCRLQPREVVKTVIHVCASTPQATHKETQGGGG